MSFQEQRQRPASPTKVRLHRSGSVSFFSDAGDILAETNERGQLNLSFEGPVQTKGNENIIASEARGRTPVSAKRVQFENVSFESENPVHVTHDEADIGLTLGDPVAKVSRKRRSNSESFLTPSRAYIRIPER